MNRSRDPYPRQEDHAASARLAEGNLATVDLCPCGVMHVHIGSMTLRLDPDGVGELLATLGQAAAAHTAWVQRERAVSLALAAQGGRRGEA